MVAVGNNISSINSRCILIYYQRKENRFIGDLIARCTSRLESFGVMTSAVQSASTRRRHTTAAAAADEEVDEVDQ